MSCYNSMGLRFWRKLLWVPQTEGSSGVRCSAAPTGALTRKYAARSVRRALTRKDKSRPQLSGSETTNN